MVRLSTPRNHIMFFVGDLRFKGSHFLIKSKKIFIFYLLNGVNMTIITKILHISRLNSDYSCYKFVKFHIICLITVSYD